MLRMWWSHEFPLPTSLPPSMIKTTIDSKHSIKKIRLRIDSIKEQLIQNIRLYKIQIYSIFRDSKSKQHRVNCCFCMERLCDKSSSHSTTHNFIILSFFSIQVSKNFGLYAKWREKKAKFTISCRKSYPVIRVSTNYLSAF